MREPIKNLVGSPGEREKNGVKAIFAEIIPNVSLRV